MDFRSAFRLECKLVVRDRGAMLTAAGWNVTGGGGFQFIASRRFNMSLSADF